MTVYTSPALVVAPDFDYEPHHPLVLWNTLVTRTNVAVSSELDAYPGINLANPNTNLRWQAGGTGAVVITLSDLGGEIDSVCIARHNFGSGQIEVTSIEGITADIGAVWTTVFGPQQVADDTPAMFRFTKAFYIGIRITLTAGAVAPQCAVLFCGELTAIKPGIAPGFTPLPDALMVDVYNGRSERGEHLGSIVSSAELQTSLPFRDVDPDFFAERLKPFFLAANRGEPFFFAWSPDALWADVSFAWFTSSCNPVVNRNSGEIDFTLELSGLAL